MKNGVIISSHNYYEFEEILTDNRLEVYKLKLALSFFNGKLQGAEEAYTGEAMTFLQSVVESIADRHDCFELFYKGISEGIDINLD